jgi:signal peptidase II
MGPGASVPVLPFFNLIMVWNSGVSYGLFQARSPLAIALLIALALAAIGGLSWWMWITTSRSLAIGIGLVIGGAIGNNLVDRVIYGRVADFFHFYGFGYDWYVFNVADVAICLGAAAIVYEVIKPHPEGAP